MTLQTAVTSSETDANPVNESVDLPEAVRTLGKEQAEVRDGRFKANRVSLSSIADIRKDVMKILDEINFDDK